MELMTQDDSATAITTSSVQVVATLAVVAYTVMAVTGCSGPAAIVLGGGLALSSTAVAMQVCYCRSVQRVIEVLSL